MICSNDWKPYMLFKFSSYWEFQLFFVCTLLQQISLWSCKAKKAENALESHSTLSSKIWNMLPPPQIMVQSDNIHSSKNLEKVCSNSMYHSQCATCILTVCRFFSHVLITLSSSNEISTQDKFKKKKKNRVTYICSGNYLHLCCTDPKSGKFLLKRRNYN